jgi:hypothetical protein
MFKQTSEKMLCKYFMEILPARLVNPLGLMLGKMPKSLDGTLCSHWFRACSILIQPKHPIVTTATEIPS